MTVSTCPATKLGTLGSDSFVAVVNPAQHLLSAYHPGEPHLPRTLCVSCPSV